MQSTKLEVLLNRMNSYQDIEIIEEQYKVEWLDSAIRDIKRKLKLPWTIQKGSLKVFDDVLIYPIASGHDELAFLDDSREPSIYSRRPRFRYTNLKDFLENPDDRNDLADIWDGGTRFIGVRYLPRNIASQRLSTAEVVGDYSVSGDADSVVLDGVVYKLGNGSMKVVITSSTGVANIKNDFVSSFVDANYKKKFHFKLVYLGAVPTTIDMRFKVDDSNYLETTGITTQFSGQALKANAWNLIAHDLNEATEVGTISTASTWASEEIILNGAATGTYYVDDSYLREWILMDYWYYSLYQVMVSGASAATQGYFKDSDGVYSVSLELIGDEEWADVIMYKALIKAAVNQKNIKLRDFFIGEHGRAWGRLEEKYPDLTQLPTTLSYRFKSDLLG